MNRQVIIFSVLGGLLILIAYWVSSNMEGKKRTFRTAPPKLVTTVFTETVKNTDIPIVITTSGNLMAKNRVELYAEVQGVFSRSDRTFKPGVRFGKGSRLLQINSDEHVANLRAQKSNLYNQVVLLLPDLKLDYAESFPKWEAYVRDYDMNGPVKALPEPASEKEKLFISGKNLYTAWYNVKNQEERLAKYTIRAPFSGILTEALVNPGTLVRAGQKLGEYIDPSVYELEVAVNTSYGNLLEIGKSVELHNVEKTQTWTGKIVRVNSRVDQASQTIPVFITVRGEGLKEGMYLEAALMAKEEKETFEINRKLLFDENKLFVVQDTLLAVATVEPVYFKENTVVVKGLKDGEKILARVVPAAHAGMRVKELLIE